MKSGQGALGDFMALLGQAASPEFNSSVKPSSVRLFGYTVPGPDANFIQLFIELPDYLRGGAATALLAGRA